MQSIYKFYSSMVMYKKCWACLYCMHLMENSVSIMLQFTAFKNNNVDSSSIIIFITGQAREGVTNGFCQDG